MKLLLIDGNNLFHRAYHALPPLTDKTGQNANAVFGFTNMILKAVDELEPDYIACAFDTQAPTFRHVEFEAYKAQRSAPPPDLYPQLPKVKSVLDSFGIKFYEKAGYEADDLLASIAILSLKSNVKITILSGDRDLLQLVNGDIKVQMPGWGLKETSLYGSKEVKEKYGLEPHQMIDYKSLVGDPSDNVPGVSGIGPKTAANLLQKYHTLENLFKHLKDTPLQVQSKLENGRETALAAKKLVALDTKIDLSFELSDLRFNPNWDKVRQTIGDLGFKSIVGKLPGASNRLQEASDLDSKKTDKSDQLELI